MLTGGGKIRGILKDGKGYVDFMLWNGSKSKAELLKLYFICFKYDVVFDTLCSVTKYLGILFCMYRPCKLVSIVHHPPFTKIMKYTRCDAYVFFDEKYRQMAIRDNPKLTERCYAIRWQPDKEWYSKQRDGLSENPVYDFIDNGKTCRDHEMMTEAVYETGAQTVLINNISLRPKAYKEGGCLTFIEQQSPNDVSLLQQILKSKCILIPCKYDSCLPILGPIGNTSFMDAIALAKPIICSDNLYFSEDVEKYKLGLVYKAGDKTSLVQCMKIMSGDENFRENCTENMRNYAKDKDITNYSDCVESIFNNIQRR